MSAVHERAFCEYKARFMPLVGALVFAGTLVTALASMALPGVFGLALIAAYLALVFDRLILFGNGWLRRRVAAKLQALGEIGDDSQLTFVGLAHPVYAGQVPRRLVETDDDVGFLRVTSQGLTYRGDALSFEIPAGELTAVRWVRSIYAPWRRIELQTRDGEPFDSLILDCRNHGSHAACRAANRRLYQQLRHLLAQQQASAAGRRLTAAEELDAVLASGR
ncbi:MAG: hypothetical protein IT204_02910 [Fimbriimonadaceae bacterium]|nr:hypothetical protein [Fimbriimonadaceae bacterium]